MIGSADSVTTFVLILGFAALVTVHVATVYGLFAKRAPALALLGILVPPAAVVGAFIRGMRLRAWLWIAAAALYASAFWVAR